MFVKREETRRQRTSSVLPSSKPPQDAHEAPDGTDSVRLSWAYLKVHLCSCRFGFHDLLVCGTGTGACLRLTSSSGPSQEAARNAVKWRTGPVAAQRGGSWLLPTCRSWAIGSSLGFQERDTEHEKIRPASSEKSYLPQGEKCAPVAEAFISLHKGKNRPHDGEDLLSRFCFDF